MKRISRARGRVGLSLLLALGMASCQSVPVSTINTNAPASNANAASPTPTAVVADGGAGEQPVTLAVMDALFAEESFVQDLKSKAGLTDEQVAELRKAAGEERGSLRESDADDHGGTTAAASERASQKIKTVLGEEKARQVLSLARARWAGEGGAGMSATAERPNALPTDTRVVVNAPAYRMDLFENGQLVKTYKVGIGYPEFPLPAGMRKADTIIYNPTWTPPDEPWVEAPGSKVKVGEKVDAGSPLNPLGPIKIPIGLPSLIHGGKSPARLGSFASHGCVGLTNAQVQEFARELARLSGTELTDADVAAYGKNKKETKNVKLSRPVTVELRYETIVATADGKLHVYRDVYDRGTNTEDNLRRVLQAHGVSFDSLSEGERTQALDAVRQMARDATGKPSEGDGVDNSNVVSPPNANAAGAKNANANNANMKNANAADSKNANTNAKDTNANAKNSNTASERVTRTVKGQKEITINIAALAGKGYPVPVNSNPPEKKEGGGAKPAEKAAPKKRNG
ncbi:MAG: L,D-transpeptidase family protein [Rubrivivax sp.]|nr:L,D-transpeptidase family protein [Pyrinomonadaceae bacterium]